MANPMVLLNNYSTASGQRMSDEYVHTGAGFECTLKVGSHQAVGFGGNKKEAKKDAADKLCATLQLIADSGGRTPPQPKATPSPLTSPITTPVSLTPKRPNVKGALQEFVQKKGWGLPKYDLINQTGPSHIPQFNISCSVRNSKGELIAEEMGTSRSKKEAENLSAEKVLAKLEGGSSSPSSPSSSLASSSPQTDRLGGGGGGGGIQQCASPGQVRNPKGLLQESLQKNQLPIPEYLARSTGPSHEKSFTVKCTVKGYSGKTVSITHGNGKTKRDAEFDAADKTLAKLSEILEKACTLVSQDLEGGGGGGEEEEEEIEDDTVDELIARVMGKNFDFPDFHERDSFTTNATESVIKLCMASAKHIEPWTYQKHCQYDISELPVVGHGMGDTEDEAKRQALVNLVTNINGLGL